MTPQDREVVGIESLVADLGDKDGMKRLHAREKLVARGVSATAALMEALESNEVQRRWEAAKALESIADPESVPSLVSHLEDEDGDVRWVAAEALARIGRPALVPLLEALADRSDELNLREGIHHVLHELEDSATRELVAPLYMELSSSRSPVSVISVVHRLLQKLT